MSKKLMAMLCLGTMIFTSGCEIINPFDNSRRNQESKQEETQGEVEQNMVSEEEFKNFFTTYFQLQEEDVLVLNQNPSIITPEYTVLYNEHLGKLTALLGNYLTDSAAESLQDVGRRFIHTEFSVPRKIEMNGYITQGPGTVEKVQIDAVQPFGEGVIYDVSVTLTTPVMDNVTAGSKYVWDEPKGYYIQREAAGENAQYYSGSAGIEKSLEASYLYVKNPDGTKVDDEIRLVEKFRVEAEKGTQLKIQSIKEGGNLSISEEDRRKVINNFFAERLPYTDEGAPEEVSFVREVMGEIFNKPRDFFDYWNKNLKSEFKQFGDFIISDMPGGAQFALEEESYRDAYRADINPYKENYAKISVNPEAMRISTSIYGTKLQPRYVVLIPADILTTNNEIKTITYQYLVGLENGKIEFIQFDSAHEGTALIDLEDQALGKEKPQEGTENTESPEPTNE